MSSPGAPKKIVLDPWDYAANLFGASAIPWTNDAEVIALARKANALLKPDRLVIPLVHWAKDAVAAMPEIAQRAAERTRTSYALKTFLGDPAFRARLSEFAHGIVGALPTTPVSFHLGSGDEWLTIAYQAAHGCAPGAVDDDVREQAGAILAGLLSALGGVQFDSLLIGAASEIADSSFFQAQAPILNVSGHYRWPVGLVCESLDTALPAGIDWLAQLFGNDASAGLVIYASAWTDLAPLADAPFYFACIPANANPEMVLARLESIKERKTS